MCDGIRIAQIDEWETCGLLVRSVTVICPAGSGQIGRVADLAFACLRVAARSGATTTGYSVVATAETIQVTFDASWSRLGAPRPHA